MTAPSSDAIHAALSKVIDPEIRKPLTELGMIGQITIDGGAVTVPVTLTVSHCPMTATIERDVHDAVIHVPGVESAEVVTSVMTPEQRRDLIDSLRTRGGSREVQFNRVDSTTRVIAIASGKGGVGKSSVTANLAATLSARGRQVGILDADVHGFSIPDLMGVEDRPTRLERDLVLPPVANGVKVMSIGVLVEPHQAVIWRGPKLHRVIEQFVSEVYWGDLDYLLIDLPPGTGDVAISVAQILNNVEMLVVTTPQPAASDVAERAGLLAHKTDQRVLGVVENMSWLDMPDGTHLELFGTGGGQEVAEQLTASLEYDVPVLGQVPLEQALREGGDVGEPIALSHPEAASSQAIIRIAERIEAVGRNLAGRKLPLSVG